MAMGQRRCLLFLLDVEWSVDNGGISCGVGFDFLDGKIQPLGLHSLFTSFCDSQIMRDLNENHTDTHHVGLEICLTISRRIFTLASLVSSGKNKGLRCFSTNPCTYFEQSERKLPSQSHTLRKLWQKQKQSSRTARSDIGRAKCFLVQTGCHSNNADRRQTVLDHWWDRLKNQKRLGEVDVQVWERRRTIIGKNKGRRRKRGGTRWWCHISRTRRFSQTFFQGFSILNALVYFHSYASPSVCIVIHWNRRSTDIRLEPSSLPFIIAAYSSKAWTRYSKAHFKSPTCSLAVPCSKRRSYPT